MSKESTVKMGVLQREVGTGQISIKKALQLIYEDVNHMFENEIRISYLSFVDVRFAEEEFWNLYQGFSVRIMI